MKTQVQKAEAFRALHARNEAFIIPNPWDVGTAQHPRETRLRGARDHERGIRVLHPACSTTRSGANGCSRTWPRSRGDGPAGERGPRERLRRRPQDVAETIRRAAATGIVGGSIEDSIDRPGEKVYEIAHAADRVRAAVEAKRDLPFPFTLTARAENYLVGLPDLADTIRRLQAYQEAGADVLYAPCITTREEITAIVKSVDRPVNFLMGTQPQRFTLAELSAMGVRRVSVGSALSAAALGAFLRGAREMRATGTFTYTQEAAGFGEISEPPEALNAALCRTPPAGPYAIRSFRNESLKLERMARTGQRPEGGNRDDRTCETPHAHGVRREGLSRAAGEVCPCWPIPARSPNWMRPETHNAPGSKSILASAGEFEVDMQTEFGEVPHMGAISSSTVRACLVDLAILTPGWTTTASAVTIDFKPTGRGTEGRPRRTAELAE